MDERLRDAFATRPRSHVGRVRVSKRRLLRVRALQFAARFLERDDATGFGFAERALKDAEELDAFLAEEISLLAKEPCEANGAVILNVRDYGAKGDGVADDAPAFSRAGEAVRRRATASRASSSTSTTQRSRRPSRRSLPGRG